ncbi:MAG: DNA polymerase III subunit epsilon [Dongiaceae bacterium]
MREIVLDTETTGLKTEEGHRIIEIGAIELIRHVPTGKQFHYYVNPLRDVPVESERISGITTAMLQDKPLFAEVVGEFLEFIAEDALVIHNAEFDMRFLNHELGLIGMPALPFARAIDTVKLARTKFPGAPANLDALCKRFNISAEHRVKHGALLDAKLLADVYVELLGGRQTALGLLDSDAGDSGGAAIPRLFRKARPHAPSEEEAKAHAEFLKNLTDPLWGEA